MMLTNRSASTTHPKLLAWVEEVAALTQPDAIHWCDGSEAEYDRMFERMQSTVVGRPELMGDRITLTLSEGMDRMGESVFINVKNRSLSITADVEIPEGGANGVILAQAGRFGGWSLYLKDGKPCYCYNYLGLRETKVAGTETVGTGKATIRLNFDYDGGGIGKGCTATLMVNGAKVV